MYAKIISLTSRFDELVPLLPEARVSPDVLHQLFTLLSAEQQHIVLNRILEITVNHSPKQLATTSQALTVYKQGSLPAAMISATAGTRQEQTIDEECPENDPCIRDMVFETLRLLTPEISGRNIFLPEHNGHTLIFNLALIRVCGGNIQNLLSKVYPFSEANLAPEIAVYRDLLLKELVECEPNFELITSHALYLAHLYQKVLDGVYVAETTHTPEGDRVETTTLRLSHGKRFETSFGVSGLFLGEESIAQAILVTCGDKIISLSSPDGRELPYIDFHYPQLGVLKNANSTLNAWLSKVEGSTLGFSIAGTICSSLLGFGVASFSPVDTLAGVLALTSGTLGFIFGVPTLLVLGNVLREQQFKKELNFIKQNFPEVLPLQAQLAIKQKQLLGLEQAIQSYEKYFGQGVSVNLTRLTRGNERVSEHKSSLAALKQQRIALAREIKTIAETLR